MAIALTIGISVVLLVLALVGYMRDLRRGTIALLGTLAGAVLVDFWGATWGASLASRLVEGDQSRTTLLVSCLLFLWSALVVGYGGGMLLARPKDRPVGQRMAGALLGLVNGLLIVGFLLRYGTAQQAGFTTTVKADLLANLINTAMPWLFLGAAAIVTVLALGRGLMRLFGRSAATPAPKPAPTPAAQPRPAAPAASGAPERRIGANEALDKVNDAVRQQGR